MASYTWLSARTGVVFSLRKALCWVLDFRTTFSLGLRPAERGHDIVGGTQNPKFRQMSKNHRRFKLWGGGLVGSLVSLSQLSPQVADEGTAMQKGEGTSPTPGSFASAGVL